MGERAGEEAWISGAKIDLKEGKEEKEESLLSSPVMRITPNHILSCEAVHAAPLSTFTVINIAIIGKTEADKRYALSGGTLTHNSGYSGLGSYGVLLMLIRFLQWERSQALKENRPEESNLGKLLVGFFKLYATFDYIHHAIDVVNIGPDGGFSAKPPVLIVKRATTRVTKDRSEEGEEIACGRRE